MLVELLFNSFNLQRFQFVGTVSMRYAHVQNGIMFCIALHHYTYIHVCVDITFYNNGWNTQEYM